MSNNNNNRGLAVLNDYNGDHKSNAKKNAKGNKLEQNNYIKDNDHPIIIIPNDHFDYPSFAKINDLPINAARHFLYTMDPNIFDKYQQQLINKEKNINDVIDLPIPGDHENKTVKCSMSFFVDDGIKRISTASIVYEAQINPYLYRDYDPNPNQKPLPPSEKAPIAVVTKPTKNKRRRLWIIGGVVVLLAIIAIIVVLILVLVVFKKDSIETTHIGTSTSITTTQSVTTSNPCPGTTDQIGLCEITDKTVRYEDLMPNPNNATLFSYDQITKQLLMTSHDANYQVYLSILDTKTDQWTKNYSLFNSLTSKINDTCEAGYMCNIINDHNDNGDYCCRCGNALYLTTGIDGFVCNNVVSNDTLLNWGMMSVTDPKFIYYAWQRKNSSNYPDDYGWYSIPAPLSSSSNGYYQFRSIDGCDNCTPIVMAVNDNSGTGTPSIGMVVRNKDQTLFCEITYKLVDGTPNKPICQSLNVNSSAWNLALTRKYHGNGWILVDKQYGGSDSLMVFSIVNNTIKQSIRFDYSVDAQYQPIYYGQMIDSDNKWIILPFENCNQSICKRQFKFYQYNDE